ncbi:substrate-binding domain-containing protein [Ligilactobacillus sp.]|uniref:substrate-binding domain-containing protein n=1 Tax=Ligilactobacillus sp. TaxID=2767921 RepID=UPI002FE394D2
MKNFSFRWEDAVPAVMTVIIIWLCYLFMPPTRPVVRIGATYMTMNNTFYTVINDEIRKKADDRGAVLKTLNPVLSVKNQCRQIETFIREDFDVIIINPVSGTSRRLNEALGRAKRHGIKIVVVDSQMKNSKNVDCTVVSDNYNAGVLCARNMMKTMPEADILLLRHWNAMSVKERYRGFSDTIKDRRNYRIVKRVETLGQTEVSMPEVRKTVKDGTNFNVVMALDDQSAVGALAALDSCNVRRPVRVYGIDGSTSMKKLLKAKGDAWATVAQSPIRLGEEAADVSFRVARDMKVPKRIVIPVHMITRENVDRYNVEGWQ